MDDGIIEKIKIEITTIQTEFIMELISLCEKYGVDKTTFIRNTVSELYELTQNTNFNYLQYN